jgi:uncharacterized DUF497 family protein
VSLTFEWDSRKAEANLSKHSVTFKEATTVFGDPLSATVPDAEHSDLEERFLTIGWLEMGRLLIVAHSERGDRIRIISARELTSTEKRQYEEFI